MTNGFDLDHDLDVWILKVKCDLNHWPHTWPWPWIFMVKFWNIHDHSSAHLVTKVRCMDLPDSNRVTSVVGVPSTHLVVIWNWACHPIAFSGGLMVYTIISMTWHTTALSPVLTNWGYYRPALSLQDMSRNVWYTHYIMHKQTLWPCRISTLIAPNCHI